MNLRAYIYEALASTRCSMPQRSLHNFGTQIKPGYMPRGPNVAISLSIVSTTKQNLCYFCMHACCPFSKRLARLSGQLAISCMESSQFRHPPRRPCTSQTARFPQMIQSYETLLCDRHAGAVAGVCRKVVDTHQRVFVFTQCLWNKACTHTADTLGTCRRSDSGRCSLQVGSFSIAVTIDRGA